MLVSTCLTIHDLQTETKQSMLIMSITNTEYSHYNVNGPRWPNRQSAALRYFEFEWWIV